MEVWASFCATCGQRIDREDNFCRKCGSPLPKEPLESDAVMPSPPPKLEAVEEQLAPAAEAEKPFPENMPLGTFGSGTSSLFGSPARTSAPAELETPYRVSPAPRKARLPVLEILIVILLTVGAGVAVWMVRSSVPPKNAAPASEIEVTVTPATAKVVAGKACDLAASVSGADDVQVSWSVREGDAGGRVINRGAHAENGTVSLQAVYVAPKTPGTYHVVATSNADPSKSGEAEITVVRR
ncbi:MAG: zinc-ribbon domain-containing protein [Candidatus Korobacteraceae bacterium]